MTTRKKAVLKSTAEIFIIVLSGIYLALEPKEVSGTAAESLEFCFKTVIPSLFPFMVLSSLFISLGGAQLAGVALSPVMRVFRVGGSGAAALILGLAGGYPIGAKTAAALYSEGLTGKKETEKLIGFAANCGPGFIVGFVGLAVFGSTVIGLELYIIHILSAILTGLVLRGVKCDIRPDEQSLSPKRTPFSAAFTDSVKGSFHTCIDICAFVVFFSVMLSLLQNLKVLALPAVLLKALGADPAVTECLLTGLFEMANGAKRLSKIADPRTALTAASFLLAWGGISVHCQTAAVLRDSGIGMRYYIIGKTVQSFIAAAAAAAYYRIKSPDAAAFFPDAERSAASEAAPVRILLPVFLVLLCVCLLFCLSARKKVEKQRQILYNQK